MSKIIYLKNDKDFTKCIKKGNKINTKDCLIFYSLNNLSHSRIGISVSKKVSKLAVIRNLIKRQIRSFFYTSMISLLKNFDLVIIVKKEYCLNKYSNVLMNLKKQLNNKKMIKI